MYYNMAQHGNISSEILMSEDSQTELRKIQRL